MIKFRCFLFFYCALKNFNSISTVSIPIPIFNCSLPDAHLENDATGIEEVLVALLQEFGENWRELLVVYEMQEVFLLVWKAHRFRVRITIHAWKLFRNKNIFINIILANVIQ